MFDDIFALQKHIYEHSAVSQETLEELDYEIADLEHSTGSDSTRLEELKAKRMELCQHDWTEDHNRVYCEQCGKELVNSD